jgi:hypothetical protein
MDKNLGLDIENLAERKAFLKDNCDMVENLNYMKPFTPDKIIELKESLAEVSIKIDDIEGKKKLQNEVFKDALKPLNEEKLAALSGIRQRAEQVNEVCYTFIYQEDREVATFNELGERVSVRPALQSELQGTIHQMLRTGTNN